jgi:hypothetical protein
MLPDHEAAVAARAADALYFKHSENERSLRTQAAAEHEKTVKPILDQAEQERAKMVESKRKSSEHIESIHDPAMQVLTDTQRKNRKQRCKNKARRLILESAEPSGSGTPAEASLVDHSG